MSTQIFVNLPVKDLKRSMNFFTALGYAFNPAFTNDKGACMVISDDIFAMLVKEEFFRTFTPKNICDAAKNTEVLIALSAENRRRVDDLVNKAIAAGGAEPRPPQDQGFMYGRSFQDPDGHIWEIFWMDPAGMPAQ